MGARLYNIANVNGATDNHAAPYAGIFRRAVVIALILGTALTLLNQSEAVFGQNAIQYLPLALVYLFPFIVVSVSQYLGIRQALVDTRNTAVLGPLREHPLVTPFRHGIPVRAVIVGLIIGTFAAGIYLLAGNPDVDNIRDLPIALTAQGYILPAFFGLFSQTVAYRRILAARNRT
jgi:purine-cytosine permease-like protein